MDAAIQRAYEEIHAFFSKPDAVLGRDYEAERCIYSSLDGDVRCAVGCRLPLEWIERHGINAVNVAGGLLALANTFPSVEKFVGDTYSDLFYFHLQAQTIHDVSENVESFLCTLTEMATRVFGCVAVGENVVIAEREAVTV